MVKFRSNYRIEREVYACSGAKASRVIHSATKRIEPHHHDWVCLTLPILGGCTEEYEQDTSTVKGPSLVLHPAGQQHANRIHETGLDCLSIRFDPSWLSSFGFKIKLEQSRVWRGGKIPIQGLQLFSAWARSDLSETVLAGATAEFIELAVNQVPVQQPPWMGRVLEAIAGPAAPTTKMLAKELGMHPASLARSYRQHNGEGLASTRCRLRLEAAAELLRGSDEPLAEVAVAAGFCDQSHMARVSLAFTGKTPLQIRAEIHTFRSGDLDVRDRNLPQPSD